MRTNAQTTETNVKTPLPSLFAQTIFTMISCAAVYAIIAGHFLLAVKAAHFLGDATYLPPSVLRYTEVFFRSGEVSALVEIVFLVVWLVFLIVTCAAMFWAVWMAADFIGGVLPSVKDGIADCLATAFFALLPVLILSVLTLSITPLTSTKNSSPSMSEIAEQLSFGKFLAAMDENTIAMFGVGFFVTITLAVAVFLTKFLPDSPPMFFIAIFVGVIAGVAVLMPVMSFGAKGFELVQNRAGSAVAAHCALFAVYSLASAIFVMPVVWERKTKKLKPAAV